jgi:hypothetical protein
MAAHLPVSANAQTGDDVARGVFSDVAVRFLLDVCWVGVPNNCRGKARAG